MEKDKPLIIIGSARKQSDTKELVNRLFTSIAHEQIDLLDYKVYPYDYSAEYPADDDFLLIIDKLLQRETLIFATPVYWYAMSGLMKNFFDRFTDLVTVHKKLGRQQKGKRTFLIAVGTDEYLSEGCEVPFRLTSKYLDMKFITTYYSSRKKLDTDLADATSFLNLLSN